ncbi:hypothetical protein CsatA_026967 [Cannabis sativa]
MIVHRNHPLRHPNNLNVQIHKNGGSFGDSTRALSNDYTYIMTIYCHYIIKNYV